jgi:hypothetical protein
VDLPAGALQSWDGRADGSLAAALWPPFLNCAAPLMSGDAPGPSREHMYKHLPCAHFPLTEYIKFRTVFSVRLFLLAYSQTCLCGWQRSSISAEIHAGAAGY